jgi:hypothetical protein
VLTVQKLFPTIDKKFNLSGINCLRTQVAFVKEKDLGK